MPQYIPAIEELLDALEDVINQACRVSERDGPNVYDEKAYHLDSMALSAYAYGMRTLAKFGRLKILKEYGRRVIGEWPTSEKSAENAAEQSPSAGALGRS